MIRLFAAAAGLALLSASSIGAAPGPAPVALTNVSVRAQLQALIQHEMKRRKIAGMSIALVDDQTVIWSQGFGWADAAAKVPASPDTRYRVGSISKLFTDTAAMQLVAQGRLGLDAPIQAAVPWFRIGTAWPDAGPITLRQLMSHHSGLPRDVSGGMWLRKAPGEDQDHRAMLRALSTTEVDAPPELIFSYSNVGLNLVGMAVENATGRRFEDRVQTAVLDPLGMTGASFSSEVPRDAMMARGHDKGKGQDEPALRDVPAGGLNASVTDLAKFLMMQFAGGRAANGAVVIPEAQRAAMLQRQFPGLPLDADSRIGLGWMLSSYGSNIKGGGPMAHHGGGTPFFHSELAMLPDQKLGVIVVSNDSASTEAVNLIAQRALALMLEARRGIKQTPMIPGFVPARTPWTEAQRTAAQAACVGDYVSMVGPATIAPKGKGLSMSLFGRRLAMREGEGGQYGLRFSVGGLIPINLGPLSQTGLQCTTVAGRNVLIATLDGDRVVAGERLAAPVLPANADRWVGNYRWLSNADDFAVLGANSRISVRKANGRLWVEYTAEGMFAEHTVLALQPVSDTTARLIGPLADIGPVIQLVDGPGAAPRVRYSGMTFEKLPE